jgi:hypothetical protein
MRIWMLSAATVTTAIAMGVALGGYATSPQRPPLENPPEPYDYAQTDTPVPGPADRGPRTIHCIGCGPTLADRRMAAMTGYDSDGMISGSRDPVVQDYLAEADPLPPVEAPVPVIRQLPPNIVRFARGPSPASRPAAAPAPAQPAEGAIPMRVVMTDEGAGQASGAPPSESPASPY